MSEFFSWQLSPLVSRKLWPVQTSSGTDPGNWAQRRRAGRLRAQTERPLGGWLRGLGWQCGRWTSSLGGWLVCVVAGRLAAQPDCVSTWQFWLRLRQHCRASHTRSIINIAVEIWRGRLTKPSQHDDNLMWSGSGARAHASYSNTQRRLWVSPSVISPTSIQEIQCSPRHFFNYSEWFEDLFSGEISSF